MINKKKKRFALSGWLVLSACITLLYAGCKKDSGYYGYQNQRKEFDGTTYDFLKSEHQYDSFLLAIDRLKLTDTLRNGLYTVFAPTDASFKQAIENMNTLRTIQGRAHMYINTVPYEQLDSLVCRYIIRDTFSSRVMTLQDGLGLTAIKYSYPMHGKFKRTDAEGHVEGGPGVITFSDTKGVIYTNRWSKATTVAIDVVTKTGLVNVLEKDHMFGFDEFIPRMNPTVSSPWNDFPLYIPGIIGMEQFNRGGNKVAYLDFSLNNQGGQYRPADQVDITTAGEGGLKVGWTETGEWLDYTVEVTETGEYDMTLRYGSGGDDGRIHLEMNGRPVIGSAILMPGTGGYDSFRDITTTVQLTAGRHVLKVYYDFANFDLRFLKFVRKNAPMPIPGVITLEDYDPGGEGVGYHDNNTRNEGNKYRQSEGVDIDFAKNEGGGYQIGWTGTGEWMNYTVNVKQTGTYNTFILVGSEGVNGRFHLEFDGVDVTGPLKVPNTGGYHKRQSIATSVYLTKGTHVMRFFIDHDGFDVKSVTFRPLN
ncbi:carbohydrate-binding protein [Chitinophaga rhizophila]|uniref:Carbohydrate-binding protein n=1 Tax=Chitinophaga rhizophila TaxID=2866212 RepID=A0ABS7G919_9BACT|nr:carbohydrate-binding protein [Chitinophaga rhizophila]MBW8684161.1 carbohydrate-binding protein [Chitinophaga rhizophila]